MHTWGMYLQDLADRNGGLILTRDLKQLGLGDGAIRRLTRSLYRICRGAYALEPPADEWAEHRLLARAVALRHERLVAVSHLSAAVLHGLPLWRVELRTVHVTGLRTARRGVRSGVHTHEGSLLLTEVVDLDGLEVTNVARTVMDCARSLPFDRAVAIADHALHTGQVTLADLQRRAASMPAFTGIDEARRLVLAVDGRAESPGESRSRLVLVDAGIAVESQVPIFAPDGTFIARVDLLVEGRVVVEFDGKAKYALSGDVERAHWEEKRRHDALQEAGYVVVRLTWSDLSHPAEIVARVRRAIARAKAAAA